MKPILFILTVQAAIAQTSLFPGAIDNNSSLFVVADNVQTTLNVAMTTSDTAMVVASAAGFVPNMIVTICDTTTNTGKCTAWENMFATGVAGNVITVTRAFAGTSARTHAAGRLVSIFINSAHQQVLKSAVIAIETALGPNLTNISASGPLISADVYKFSAYSCNSSSSCSPGGPSGMSLIAGNNTLTMTPVPLGVNGTDTGHSLYVSGGTGTAGACAITGGSGSSGQPSGQIIINCANTHSGAWTITSASGGIQESICGLPAAGGDVMAASNATLFSDVTTCGKTSVHVQKQLGAALSGTGKIFASPIAGLTGVASFLSGPPVWNVTYPNYYQGSLTDIGGYPLGAHHLQHNIEAVSGSVDIPSSSSAPGGSTGGSFYARSASTNTAAVALYTQAGSTANGAIAVFGANSVVQNCDGFLGVGHCNGDGSGFSGNRMAGYEINMNNYRSDTDSVVFLNLIGASTRQAINQFDAVAVAPAGSFLYTPYQRSDGTLTNITVASTGVATITVTSGTSNALVGNSVQVYGTTGTAIIGEWPISAVLSNTQFQITVPSSITVGTVFNDAGLKVIIEALRFKNGVNILPGSADIGINLQEQKGNGFAPSNSTSINFTANDGTTRLLNQMFATANGLALLVPVGKSITTVDAAGAPFFVASLASLGLGNTTNLFIPAIKSTTGQRYVCVTTTGQIVSSATACSGT